MLHNLLPYLHLWHLRIVKIHLCLYHFFLMEEAILTSRVEAAIAFIIEVAIIITKTILALICH